MKRPVSAVLLLCLLLLPSWGWGATAQTADANPANATSIKGVRYPSTAAALTNHANAAVVGTLEWCDTQIGSSAGTIEAPPATYAVTGALTLGDATAKNLVYRPQRGAIISHGSNAVTINGVIDAGSWQIFSGTGTVTITGPQAVIRPEWFGLSPTASGAVNAAALAAAFTASWYATDKVQREVAVSDGIFNLAAPAVIPKGCWFHGTWGGNERTADAGTRFTQEAGYDGDLFRVAGFELNGRYFWYGRISDLTLFGHADSSAGSGIAFLDEAGNRVAAQDATILERLAIRRFPSHGIYLPDGALPVVFRDIKTFWNEGYGILFESITPTIAPEQGVRFDNISGDGNTLGLIGLKGLDDKGHVTLTNLKSEGRVNSDRGDIEANQNVIVFDDCVNTGVNVHGITAISSIPETTTSEFTDGAVSVGDNTITDAAHGIYTGAKGVLTTTGTLPGGLSLATTYYTIRVDADTYKLAASHADALAGTAIDILSAAGGGTHTFTLTGYKIPVSAMLVKAGSTGRPRLSWDGVVLRTNRTGDNGPPPGVVQDDVATVTIPYEYTRGSYDTTPRAAFFSNGSEGRWAFGLGGDGIGYRGSSVENPGLQLAGVAPGYSWWETDQAADEKGWLGAASSKSWSLRAVSDDGATTVQAFSVTRGTGTTIQDFTLRTQLRLRDTGSVVPTLGVDATTPSVAASSTWKTANVNPTTITQFNGGGEGSVLLVVFGDSVTTVAHDVSKIVLEGAANWTPTANDTLTLLKVGTVWYQMSRSDNTP